MEQTNNIPNSSALTEAANKLEYAAAAAEQAGCKVLADSLKDQAKRLYHAIALINLGRVLQEVSTYQKGVVPMRETSTGWAPLDLEARVWALVNPE